MRKLLLLLASVGIVAAQPPTTVHIHDTQYFNFGNPPKPGLCALQISGQSSLPITVGGATTLPAPTTWGPNTSLAVQGGSVINGVIDGYLVPNIIVTNADGSTSKTYYTVNGHCAAPNGSDFTMTWFVDADAPAPLKLQQLIQYPASVPSISLVSPAAITQSGAQNGQALCWQTNAWQPCFINPGSGTVNAPNPVTIGFVPVYARIDGTLLGQGFPVAASSTASAIVETDLTGKLDATFFPFLFSATPAANTAAIANGSGQLAAGWAWALSGVIQSAAGSASTTLSNPSGNGAKVMTGAGSFTVGHSPVFDAGGNIIDSGGTAGQGSVTVSGSPVTGFIPSWTGSTQLGPGFQLAQTASPSAILELLGSGLISPTVLPALSGTIHTSAGSAVTSLTNPSGNGLAVVTGTGTYTPGHGLIIDSGGNVVDIGTAPGSGSGNVFGPGPATAGTLAVFTGTSNTIGVGPSIATAPGANVVVETGAGSTIDVGFLQQASLSQIGAGNVASHGGQITFAYAGGTATPSLANPLTIPGPTTFAAATTGGPSFTIPNGTGPSVPTTGNFWASGGVLNYYDGATAQTLVFGSRSVIASAPLTGGTQPFSSNVTIGIQTAGSSQIGAGNVAPTTNQVCVSSYSGGTATLALCPVTTFPGTANFTAGTTSIPSFTIPSGVAPTSPAAGNIWNQSGVLHLFAGTDQSILTSATTAGGDISGTFSAFVVNNVHGVSYPSSSSAGAVAVGTGASTVANAILPSCPDSAGNHLNWDGSSWICGNTGGTAGSVAWPGVLPGTSTIALLMGTGGSLGFTGTGTVNASNLNGVPFPTLGSINTVPVITSVAGAGTVTYELLPNTSLANSSVTVLPVSHQTTVSGGSLALGGTVTVGTVQSIDTTSSPTFAGETIGTMVLAGSGSGTSTFTQPGTVITTGTAALVANAMLQHSSIVVTTAAPLAGAGTISLGNTLALSIATASAIQIGAGNVAGGSQVLANYSGGTATLSFVDPTPFNIINAATINASANITATGTINAGGALTSGNVGTSIIAASLVSGVTVSGSSPWNCTFTISGGLTTAIFTYSFAGSPGALPAAPLTFSSGGTGFLSLPTTAAISGTGCSGGSSVITTALLPASVALQDGALGQNNGWQAPLSGVNVPYGLPESADSAGYVLASTGTVSLYGAHVTQWLQYIAAANGGTAGDSSAATGIAHIGAGVWSYSPVNIGGADVVGQLPQASLAPFTTPVDAPGFISGTAVDVCFGSGAVNVYGCMGMTEGSTALVGTSGYDIMQADSVSHGFKVSNNGSNTLLEVLELGGTATAGGLLYSDATNTAYQANSSADFTLASHTITGGASAVFDIHLGTFSAKSADILTSAPTIVTSSASLASGGLVIGGGLQAVSVDATKASLSGANLSLGSTGVGGTLTIFGATSGSLPISVNATSQVLSMASANMTISAAGAIVETSSKIAPVTVGTLGTCNSGAEGTRKGVTDALAPTALTTVAAGGSVHVPVYCNGTNWIVF